MIIRPRLTQARQSLGVGKQLIAGLLCSSLTLALSAGPREQAKRIHERLAVTPPSASVLDTI